MRAETTSCRFPRGRIWSSSTLTCAPIVSRISNAVWPGGLIRSPRAWRLSAPSWGRCHPIRLRWGRWWKSWSIRRGGCAAETNDYSVPIQYAYQRLTLKADPFRVCLFDGAELVADHPRCYQKRQVIEDWRHYVPLLLKKSFAVPWASALRHGDLPPTFEAARRRVSGSTCRWQSGVCPAPGTVSDPRGFGGRDRPGPGTRGIRGWSADAVRQLLNFASTPDVPVPPLDPSKSPAYQGMTPPPDLSAYNRLLEVQP